MASSFDVVVDEPTVVKPASTEGTPPILYLHNIEQQVFFQLEINFIFPVVSAEGIDVVELLHESLEKALVPYYFLAGRYKINEEQGRLELNCNGEGALFAGAQANISIEQLGDFSAPNPMFKKLLLYPKDVQAIEEIPLLTVQVTKFACGGVVVGFCVSHVVFDGISLSNFFHHYARTARGDPLMTENDLLKMVNPDRSFMRTRSPLQISYPHTELAALPDVPAKVLFNSLAYNQLSPPVPPKFFFKTFSFTPEMLRSLKWKAGPLRSCSAFEVLAAHVWQSRTKAMHHAMDPDLPSKLFLVVDVRKKFQSTIPSGYSGNAIVAAPCNNVSAANVCNNSLSFCVKKVQQTIRSVNEEYTRSQLDWCEMKHGIIDLPGGLLITTWSKLGFDLVDFGWGLPAYVAPLVHSRTEYVTFLPNCRGDGGIDIFMAMEFQPMVEFEQYLLHI